MIRVLVEYLGDNIELLRGDTIVGRDLACQIRLNDPAVSRRHVRFAVQELDATVEDLGSSNGTTVNSRPLMTRHTLVDGDQVRIGGRLLKVRVLAGSEAYPRASVEDTLDRLPAQILLEASESIGDAIETHLVAERVPPEVTPAPMRLHNCPQCRRAVLVTSDRCPHCGYRWSRERPHAVTQTGIALPLERRQAARHSVDVAVIYTSDALSFEAVARDLSRTGMFVATELLEPAQTPCRIVVLLDGNPAVSFAAEVCRVVSDAGGDSSPSGLGVRFTEMSDDAERWLTRVLERMDPDGIRAETARAIGKKP